MLYRLVVREVRPRLVVRILVLHDVVVVSIGAVSKLLDGTVSAVDLAPVLSVFPTEPPAPGLPVFPPFPALKLLAPLVPVRGSVRRDLGPFVRPFYAVVATATGVVLTPLLEPLSPVAGRALVGPL